MYKQITRSTIESLDKRLYALLFYERFGACSPGLLIGGIGGIICKEGFQCEIVRLPRRRLEGEIGRNSIYITGMASIDNLYGERIGRTTHA